MAISRLGVWDHATSPVFQGGAPAELERLGYGTAWLGGSPSADLTAADPILAGTSSLRVATGIVNVWDAPASAAAAGYHRVAAAHPGRILLGIGAGHRSMVGDRYTKPYDKLVSYLDGLDEGGVPVDDRVLAALGPRVLELSRDRAAGAHPYLVTPEHTAQAREILGAGKLLVPEQKVVLTSDPAEGRALGRARLEIYLSLPNYTNNWQRLGFTEADLADGGSDRLVDAMVVWGDAEKIRARVQEHWDAGADQVALQVLNEDKMEALRALTPALV